MRSEFGETGNFHITEAAILSLRIFNNLLGDLVLICVLSEWALGFGITRNFGLAEATTRDLHAVFNVLSRKRHIVHINITLVLIMAL